MTETPHIDLRMVPDDGPIVAMVSGGSDSTALLLLLTETVSSARIHVLHVNHCLRGDDSDADERFVLCLCAVLGVTCTVQRVDVAEIAAAEKGNLEAVARRERYAGAHALLEKLCEEAGVPVSAGRIVTAHTRDDRVETFLMRASVGTGPGGLASIRPQAGLVAHPLLSCTREELRAWLRSRGQDWREDVTNLTSDRDRTFMRNEVLPLLRVHNHAFDANLARTMDLIADEDDYLFERASELFIRAQDVVDAQRRERILATLGIDGPALLLDAPTITEAPRVLARRAVRQAFVCVGGPDLRPDARHIEWTVDGAAREGFAADVSKTLSVRNVSQTLVFTSASDHVACDASLSDCVDVALPIPGSITFTGGRSITASEVAVPESGALQGLDGSREAIVDVGDAACLWVGCARFGERMVPLGFGEGSKKLSDALVDAKVPRASRRQVPVVRASHETGDVVWLAGLCVDERHRIAASTVRAVRLTFE